MDRNREARRSSTMVAAVRLSRRRYKTISARNPIEGGHADLLATVRLRERTNKRDREKNLISRGKRRRGGAGRVDFEADEDEDEDEDEEGEESDGESFGSEEDDEVEDGSGIPRTLSLSTAYSASNQNDRRSSLPPKVSKQTWKVADDMMIGVPIPRKTRSASAKRSHENAVSGTCGGRGVFAEEKSHQNQSDTTQASFADLVSPSSSNISDTKKIKSVGSSTQTPPSQQNDIEFEVAEVLSGLMKQHQTFEKPGSPRNSSWKTEPENINHIGDESKRSISLQSAPSTPPSLVLCHGDNHAADPSHDDDTRKIKADNDIAKSSASVEDDLLAAAVHTESKHPVDLKTHSTKIEMVSNFHENQKEAFRDIFALEGPKLSPSSVVKGDDLQDSTMKKEISSVEKQREEKLEFDLMISPPKSSSPVWDGLSDSFSEPKPIGLNIEMNANVLFEGKKKVEQSTMDETLLEEKQGKRINEKLNPYLEKQNQDDIFKLQLKDPKYQSRKTAIKVEKNDKSCLSPKPTALDYGYNSLPPFGWKSSTQAGSQLSTIAQPPQCHLSQRRPRRCVTHYYIAQNIYSHQQFTKMNCFSQALNGSHAIKLAPADFSGDGGNDKRIEVINFIDRVQEKQAELLELQSTQPGDLVHGHTFKTQHQTGVPARVNHPGDLKSASSPSNATLSGKPVAAALPPFSAQTTNFGFNYSNSSLNQAPYLAILPNKGIPIPISTPVGSSTAYKASTPQGMQFFNGSWYPSHMFHHSQLQHQPPLSQSIPPSRGSSSSCKQPIQQPWSVQATGNNYLLASSDTLQQQQSLRQNVQQSNQASKVEETIRNTVSYVSDSKPLNPQTNIGLFTLPTQMLNFSLGPSSMLGGEEGGNHGENQHNQKLQTNSLNGKVELVPSQPTAMQLASFNGNGLASSLNFTTVAQNLTLFQNLPDQASAPGPQAIQQKNQQTSEKKSTSFSSAHDEYKKGNCGNSSTATGQTLVFNNPSRTLNFMQPPASGNWSPCSVTSTAILAKGPASDRATCSQQQVLRPIQLQQPQSMRTPQSKTLTHNSKPSAPHVVNCPNNVIAFQQPLIMCSSSVQSCQPKTSERSMGPLVPVQQGKAPRGQTQISFGGNHKTSLVTAATSSK